MNNNIMLKDMAAQDDTAKFVVIRLDGQLFALPVMIVEDVVIPQKITPIPLAPDAIAGLLNLRGIIITVMDLRIKMGLSTKKNSIKAIIINHLNNLYGFIADEVSGVYDLPTAKIEHNPDNLSEEWQKYCSGIYKTDDELMIILNVDNLFNNEKGW